MKVDWSDIFYMTLGVLIVAFIAVILVAYEVQGSTDEREAIEAIPIVDRAAMDELAATVSDADASPPCRGYADTLLYAAAVFDHALEYPESSAANTELMTRILPAVAAYQYACENAL